MRVSLAKRIENIKRVAKTKAPEPLVKEHLDHDFDRCARIALKGMKEEHVVNLLKNLTLLVYVSEKRHNRVVREVLALQGR